MRIALGVAELLVELLERLVGEGVLHRLGVTMQMVGGKAQPLGGWIGDGSSPSSFTCSFGLPGSATGVAESSARV